MHSMTHGHKKVLLSSPAWMMTNPFYRKLALTVVIPTVTLLLFIGFFLHLRLTYTSELARLNKSLSRVTEHKTHLELMLGRRTRENNIMHQRLASLPNGTAYLTEFDFKYSRGRGKTMENASPLVIIIPFIRSQIPRLREHIRRWSLPKYAPLDVELPDFDNTPTDLIFYYNKADDAVMEEQIRAIVDEFDLRKMFRDIYFYYADLSEEEDKYPLATSHMFYKLIDDENLRRRYHYMFYMEPDVIVIRKGWMQILHLLAFNRNRPFFVLGSMNRGSFLNAPQHRMHINGNALYSLSDAYRDFLLEVRNNIYFVFDLDQYMYLMDHFDRQQELWHMFQFDDYIMNMYRTAYSEEQLLEENPYTVRRLNILLTLYSILFMVDGKFKHQSQNRQPLGHILLLPHQQHLPNQDHYHLAWHPSHHHHHHYSFHENVYFVMLF